MIDELFRFVARERRDSIATKVDDGVRTYGELDARSEAFAAWLLEAVSPGQRLCVLLGNQHAWVEAFLGAQKSGVPLVALHPRSGQREILHAVGQAAVGAILHDDDAPWLDSLPSGIKTLPVGDAYEEVAGATVARIEKRAAGESMVVYTSGSTMQPRGVRVTHQALDATTFLNQLLAPLGHDDRVLIFTPLAHRVALTRLMHALSSGAACVLLPRYSPDLVARTIVAEGVTAVGTVPTGLRDLCSLHATGALQALPSVRHLLVSGEPLQAWVREALPTVFPNARLHYFYATTETGPVFALEGDEALRHPDVSGRLLPGVEVQLAAYEGSEGDAGEVLVRSTAPDGLLAAGYVNQDDGELFDDDGWVHTGDVAIVDDDGYYTIVDRRKDMILSGGLNISSLEVEQVLARCPGVAEVAVTAGPDARYGECVVAWVVPTHGAELSEPGVVEFCVAHAASFKKPRHVRFVDALPRTRTGKIDKRGLREALASEVEVTRT